MARHDLGVVPVVPVIAKALPAVFSFFGQKDAKEEAARQEEYARNEQEILSGRAVMASDVMTPRDMEILRGVWPQIHVAANWNDINWAAHGMPGGPRLSPAAEIAIKHVWPVVHVAARFDDIRWQYHAVPRELVAAAMPLPELGYQTPQAAAQPNRAGVIFSSLFPGNTSEIVLTAAALGVLGLIFFNSRR